MCDSTAFGEYASRRLSTAGAGGSAKGPSSRQAVLDIQPDNNDDTTPAFGLVSVRRVEG